MDLLQFEIVFSEQYISEAEATRRLVGTKDGDSDTSVVGVVDVAAQQQGQQQRLSLEDSTPGYGDEQVQEEEEEGHGTANQDDDYASGRDRDKFDAGDDEDNYGEEHYERMLLKGKPYLCALPRVQDVAGTQNTSSSTVDQQTDLVTAAERGWQVLRDLEGKCLFFVDGWWSYSFCYNSHVKQFHHLPPGKGASMYPPEADPSTPSYMLGEISDNDQKMDGLAATGDQVSTVTELQIKGDTRYLVQKLGGGTICDLTGKERRVEVQFHCHPQSTARIGWIREVTICTYLMVVYHPRLCNDVAFLPPRPHGSHAITCREIVRSDQIDSWKKRKSLEAERRLIGEGKETPWMAGDVEIGAMKEVGTKGRRIQKGRVVTSPNERVEIISMRRGGQLGKLSSEDLKKLHLNPEAVEEYQKKVEEIAGERDWRLEKVYDRQGTFRVQAIIAEEDEEIDPEQPVDSHAEEGMDEGSEEVYNNEG